MFPNVTGNSQPDSMKTGALVLLAAVVPVRATPVTELLLKLIVIVGTVVPPQYELLSVVAVTRL